MTDKSKPALWWKENRSEKITGPKFLGVNSTEHNQTTQTLPAVNERKPAKSYFLPKLPHAAARIARPYHCG
jgi:hypothetical protein